MKKSDREWAEKFLPMLPEKPPEEVTRDMRILDELGGKRMLFSRESVCVDYDTFGFLEPSLVSLGGRCRWGARCKCSECADEFITGYGKNSIYICIGDDGCTYPGYVEAGAEDVLEVAEGEEVICPSCGENCRLTSRASLTRGKNVKTQIAGLQNIDGVAVIVYWLAERTLYRNGYSAVRYRPREAVVMTPEGGLVRFAHVKHYLGSDGALDRWQLVTTVREPAEIKFTDGGGYSYTFGSWYAETTQPMDGTTAEKTGLDDYWGMPNPVKYLQLWQNFPPVENLVRTGAAGIVSDILERVNTKEALTKFLHTKAVKPHLILGLSKEDYRTAVNYDFSLRELEMFQEYRKVQPKETAEQFAGYLNDIGKENVQSLFLYWNIGLGKIIRYLTKQSERDGTEEWRVWMFDDYQRMMREVHQYMHLGEPSPEEVFPPNLRRAHDRVMEQQNIVNAEKKKIRNAEKEGTFHSMRERMKPLEWTDGKYVIVIPEKPDDLIREGSVLHHCVGGYTDTHIEGKPIFFVRHYRRPERSWYTLNENLTNDSPHRIQLHGYHNELVNGKHLKIPTSVERFVATWERDVLAPWYKKQKEKAI